MCKPSIVSCYLCTYDWNLFFGEHLAVKAEATTWHFLAMPRFRKCLLLHSLPKGQRMWTYLLVLRQTCVFACPTWYNNQARLWGALEMWIRVHRMEGPASVARFASRPAQIGESDALEGQPWYGKLHCIQRKTPAGWSNVTRNLIRTRGGGIGIWVPPRSTSAMPSKGREGCLLLTEPHKKTPLVDLLVLTQLSLIKLY